MTENMPKCVPEILSIWTSPVELNASLSSSLRYDVSPVVIAAIKAPESSLNLPDMYLFRELLCLSKTAKSGAGDSPLSSADKISPYKRPCPRLSWIQPCPVFPGLHKQFIPVIIVNSKISRHPDLFVMQPIQLFP